MAASIEQINNELQQNSIDSPSHPASRPGPAIVITTRNYSLDINRTLKAKLNACESVSVNYEIKRGGVTGILDTASFELLRAACSAFIRACLLQRVNA